MGGTAFVTEMLLSTAEGILEAQMGRWHRNDQFLEEVVTSPSEDVGVNPKIGGLYPQNGWFIMENPITIDDLGVPLF